MKKHVEKHQKHVFFASDLFLNRHQNVVTSHEQEVKLKMENKIKLLRINDLCANFGVSRSTINRLQKNSNFPAPLKIGEKTKAWRESDIAEWLKNGGVQ
jgi:predicted DNA-binding transcriptional regulator AlpA